MKTNLKLLMILMLLPLIACSQIDYPKTVLLNNDTVTIFKFSQAKEILKELITKDYLENRIELDSLLFVEKDKQIFLYDKTNNVYVDMLKNKDYVIATKDEIIMEKDNIIKSYQKTDKKRKARNWGITTVVVAGLVTGLLLK